MPAPVALTSIRLDGGTQIRAELNQFVVDDYAAAMQGGAEFPAVVVFYDGAAHWLADGFHRYHATKQAGLTHVSADVRPGTRRDAVLFAVGANSAHGLPRTNADKRRAVEVLLRDSEWGAKSDGWVAKIAGVSQPFASKLRRELTQNGFEFPKQRLSTDGKARDTEDNDLEVRAEKRRLVARYLHDESYGKSFSDTEIAEKAKVSRQFVGKLRREFKAAPDPEEASWEASRYYNEGFAYCKYCYTTHADWELLESWGDFGHEVGCLWICKRCDYNTADEFMDLREDPDDEDEESEPEEDVEETPLPAPKPSPSQLLTPEVRQAIRDTSLSEKPEEVARLARLPEEKQAIVIAKVIEGEAEGVKEALAAVKQEAKDALAAELRAAPLPAPKGPYRVIVMDPPWRYDARAEDASHRGRNQYPDMSQAELLRLPVATLAEPDAILWLWTTNAFMRDALDLVSAWGFTEKTILTWDKVNLGLGDWLRNITEHCILAVRGRPLVTLTNQTTLITEKRREHSRKPEAFYALVEALCPGSKLEMFSREPREGWAAWGAETEKFGGEE